MCSFTSLSQNVGEDVEHVMLDGKVVNMILFHVLRSLQLYTDLQLLVDCHTYQKVVLLWLHSLNIFHLVHFKAG